MARSGGVELDKGDVRKICTVGDKIAEGNYGTVFKATNKKTGALVAFKLIENIEKDELSDVLREVAILRRLSHPNVIQLIGAYRREKTELAIITEFCGGGALSELCTLTQKPVPEPILKILMRDTTRGLAYLREVGVMHRDIKAENILLTDEGVVKLTDFGISVQLSSPSEQRKTFIGTPHWMAPEVIFVNILFAPYGIAVDVWSLGITCIELAEMQPPLFHLDGTQALIEIPRKPSPTLAYPEQWSAEMAKFLSRCVERDPANRATPAMLLDDAWFKDAGAGAEVALFVKYARNPTAVREAAVRTRKATVSVQARRETRKLLWTHAQKTRGDRRPDHDSGKPEQYFVAGEESSEQQQRSQPQSCESKRFNSDRTVNIGSARSAAGPAPSSNVSVSTDPSPAAPAVPQSGTPSQQTSGASVTPPLQSLAITSTEDNSRVAPTPLQPRPRPALGAPHLPPRPEFL